MDLTKKTIEEGIKALIQKRLNILRASAKKDEINSEVDRYSAIIRIAEQEGIDIQKYEEKYRAIIEEFYRRIRN